MIVSVFDVDFNCMFMGHSAKFSDRVGPCQLGEVWVDGEVVWIYQL